MRFDTWRAFGWYMVAGIVLAAMCLAVGLVTGSL
jgi:hypothetical protein